MRKITIAAAMLASLFATEANADEDTFTGDAFYTMCSDPASRRYCLGYVTGVGEAWNAAAGLRRELLALCPPDNHTNGQALDIAMRYLHDHPEQRRQLSRSALVVTALLEAWPCDAPAD
jgi:Rap1a immunity proteins